MCGRYSFNADPQEVVSHFSLSGLPDLTPRYNIAPSQVVAVVGMKPDGRTRGLALLTWGLVPSWSHDTDRGLKPINARAETLLDRPSFRESFRTKRCLIPATGFYEWAAVPGGKKKQPYHIRPKEGGLLGFAGLWDRWSDGRRILATCCLITTKPNELVAPIHDRMPAVLHPDEYAAWLDPTTPVTTLRGLLRPYPADRLEMVPVGPAVGSPKNDGPECLARAG